MGQNNTLVTSTKYFIDYYVFCVAYLFFFVVSFAVELRLQSLLELLSSALQNPKFLWYWSLVFTLNF